MSAFVSTLSFLLVIALLIVVHEWGHYRMAVAVDIRVHRFSIGFGKPLFIWKPKRQPLLDGLPQTTEFVIAALPFGGFVKMQDEREPNQKMIPANERHQSFNHKPLWAKVLVVFSGPLANLVLAVFLFATVNWVGMQMPEARLVEVMPSGAAAMAQLQADDVVLAVDDKKIRDSFQLRELIRASNQSVSQRWSIVRGGVNQTLMVTPRVIDENSEYLGQSRVGRIGAVIGSPKAMVEVRYGLVEGFTEATLKTWKLSALTLETLGKMIVGKASLKNLTGPLTVAEYSGKTAALGFSSFVLFLGLMSVSLGVLNLLPVPMLDGGHLMYYLWEFITGKAVSDAWLDRFQRIGFAALILLTVLALYNDLVRVFGLHSFFG
jgi:membrane-associated protease RseP (regulator of RpoE activity)